jgi:hypothetical protein
MSKIIPVSEAESEFEKAKWRNPHMPKTKNK